MAGDILNEAAGAAKFAAEHIANEFKVRPEEVGELLFQLISGGFSDGHGD
jgi:hypothetical protein